MYAFMYERAYLCARQWEQISIETRRQSGGRYEMSMEGNIQGNIYFQARYGENEY